MDRIQKIILISIISTAAISWILSKDQPDMMMAMMNSRKLYKLFCSYNFEVC